MKGNVLQSVIFTHNGSADSLPQPEKLLLMSAGAYSWRAEMRCLSVG